MLRELDYNGFEAAIHAAEREYMPKMQHVVAQGIDFLKDVEPVGLDPLLIPLLENALKSEEPSGESLRLVYMPAETRDALGNPLPGIPPIEFGFVKKQNIGENDDIPLEPALIFHDANLLESFEGETIDKLEDKDMQKVMLLPLLVAGDYFLTLHMAEKHDSPMIFLQNHSSFINNLVRGTDRVKGIYTYYIDDILGGLTYNYRNWVIPSETDDYDISMKELGQAVNDLYRDPTRVRTDVFNFLMQYSLTAWNKDSFKDIVKTFIYLRAVLGRRIATKYRANEELEGDYYMPGSDGDAFIKELNLVVQEAEEARNAPDIE